MYTRDGQYYCGMCGREVPIEHVTECCNGSTKIAKPLVLETDRMDWIPFGFGSLAGDSGRKETDHLYCAACGQMISAECKQQWDRNRGPYPSLPQSNEEIALMGQAAYEKLLEQCRWRR